MSPTHLILAGLLGLFLGCSRSEAPDPGPGAGERAAPGGDSGPAAGKGGKPMRPLPSGKGGRPDPRVGGEKAGVQERVAPPPAATAAGKVAVGGKTYVHPLGFRFRYPEAWRMQEVEDGVLALIPDDIARGPQGAEEVLLVMGSPAEGRTDPSDPGISAELDSMMASSFPFLRRTGGIRKLRLGARPFALYAWKGANPAGKTFEARAWVCLLEGYALGVLAVMEPQRFALREAMCRAVASSIHFKAPSLDPILAGTWSRDSNFSSGEYSSTIARVMTLRPDGKAFWRSRMQATIEKGAMGRDTGEAGILPGRWAASKGRLYIVWENGGEEEYSYYREEDSLLLTPMDGGGKELWTIVR